MHQTKVSGRASRPSSAQAQASFATSTRDQSPLPLAAYVILGMLALGDGSGYDIKRRVERSTRYFSTISDAQIYPLLKQLEGSGLVRGRPQPRGQRPRQVYKLTPQGRTVLRAWLRSPEPLLLEVWDTGLLKLFFADAIDLDEALELIDAIRDRSQRILAELQTHSQPPARAAHARGHTFPELIIQFGTAMHQAWTDCCDQLERELCPPSRPARQPARPARTSRSRQAPKRRRRPQTA